MKSLTLRKKLNKTQGFRVELQVLGGVEEVTGKGQNRDKTRARKGQDRDKSGTRQ